VHYSVGVNPLSETLHLMNCQVGYVTGDVLSLCQTRVDSWPNA